MIARANTSASNLFRRDICKGSAEAEAEAEAELPEEEDSEYSAEGTLLHALDSNPAPEQEAKLTTEQREVLAIARKGDADVFAAVSESLQIPEGETFEEGYEKEMWFRRGIKALFPGHCDRWRYYPRFKILIITDKKFGRKDVQPAEANLQLRAYAVMGAALFDCDHVMVAIIQPRKPFEERANVASYDRQEIIAAKEHILQIWDDAHKPGAPRTADAEACQYCKARIMCDAYRAKYEWMAAPSEDGKDAFVGKLTELDDLALDKVWRAITFAMIVREPTKKEIVRRNAAGGMPMYELADTGNTSTINDPVQAMALLKAAGLAEAEVTACAKFSKEKLAEKLLNRSDIPSLAAAKRKLGEILRPALEITPKDPSLKRIKGWKPEPTQAALDNGSDATLFPV